jgi:hypothetical protein
LLRNLPSLLFQLNERRLFRLAQLRWLAVNGDPSNAIADNSITIAARLTIFMISFPYRHSPDTSGLGEDV